ncbi:hypothetical protein IWQ60_003489 [Tieghemiomyces parasiticus]|uniref:DNA (cytosine-5-)-methyltransferase n=1 Tax=Tieghemiomyces parasiticus TaxID=78921 RepID=A0A9W8A9H9_9FUNG|nr:hypothetical protein IWQ60_003489 [Tieghemiomyces parasiticus]
MTKRKGAEAGFLQQCKATYPNLFKKYRSISEDTIAQVLDDVSMDELDAEETLTGMAPVDLGISRLTVSDHLGSQRGDSSDSEDSQPRKRPNLTKTKSPAGKTHATNPVAANFFNRTPKAIAASQTQRETRSPIIIDLGGSSDDEDNDLTLPIPRMQRLARPLPGPSTAHGPRRNAPTTARARSPTAPAPKVKPARTKPISRSSAPPIPAVEFYDPLPGEISENEHLEVVGEDGDFDEDGPNGEGDNQPCRMLTNFVIYDFDNGNRLVPLDEFHTAENVVASGDVRPIFRYGFGDEEEEEDDDGDDEGEVDDEDGTDNQTGLSAKAKGKQPAARQSSKTPVQRIRLSAVFHYEEQYLKSGLSVIWLRTSFAWYKLCRPLDIYERHYLTMFKALRLANLLISWSLAHPAGSYSQFTKALPDMATRGIGSVGTSNLLSSDESALGGCQTYASRHDYEVELTGKDLTVYAEFVINELECWVEECQCYEIIEMPVIQEIMSRHNGKSSGRRSRGSPDVTVSAPQRTRPVAGAGGKRKPAKKLPENAATVTPHISTIAHGLFKKNIVAVKVNHADQSDETLILNGAAAGAVVKEEDVAETAAAGMGSDEEESTTPADVVVASNDDSAAIFVTRPLQAKSSGLPLQSSVAHGGQRYYAAAEIVFADPSDPANPRITPPPRKVKQFFERRIAVSTPAIVGRTLTQIVRLHDFVYVVAHSSRLEARRTPTLARSNPKRYPKPDDTAATNAGIPVIVMVTGIFDDPETKRTKFHGRLLDYGRETVLGEVASPHELFLTDACDTFDIEESFRGLCRVQYCRPDESNVTQLARFGISRGFFFRYWYDHETGTFEDVERHTVPRDRWPTEPAFCPACAKRQCQHDATATRWVIDDLAVPPTYAPAPTTCLVYGGVTYHLGDFVYLAPLVPGTPYRIGQVVGFNRNQDYIQRVPARRCAPLGLARDQVADAGLATRHLSSDPDSDDDQNDRSVKIVIEPLASKLAREDDTQHCLPGSSSVRTARGHLSIREYVRMDDVPVHQLPVSDRTFTPLSLDASHTHDIMLADDQDHAHTLDGTPEQPGVRRLARYGSSNSSAGSPSVSPVSARTKTPSHPKGYDGTAQLKFPIKDSRHLFATANYECLEPDQLEGKCWVEYLDRIPDLETFKAQDSDAFYVEFEVLPAVARHGKDPWRRLADGTLELARSDLPVEFSPMRAVDLITCAHCDHRRRTRLQHRQLLLNTVADKFHAPLPPVVPAPVPQTTPTPLAMRSARPLVGLDIFSGCGGLTTGLESSGIVETRYAVEFFDAAAVTFEKNYPGATVYHQCANMLLARAIAQHRNGETLEPEEDLLGRPLPDMPHPDDVDFIYCGPPCQGFSGANRFPKADDIKNTLITTSLSYVDFYRPRFFLLENVYGMVNFMLGGTQAGQARIAGGIKMGVVKFIIRALTSMGYQVRFSVQQAGLHGLPQSRRRFFVWGAQRGEFLPRFPQPITCFKGSVQCKIKLPRNPDYETNRRTRKSAPHHAITVQDAISDLPAFEYVNPNLICPPEETEDKAHRIPHREPGAVTATGSPATDPCAEPMFQLLIRMNFVAKSAQAAERVRREAMTQVLDDPCLGNSLTAAGDQRDLFRPTSTVVTALNATSRHILEWEVARTGFVGAMHQPYQCPPLSQYQRERRWRAERLCNHVTRAFNSETVERICRVAMLPGADHRGLPDKLKPWCLSSPDSAADRHNGWPGLFGRLDYRHHFLTTLTDVQPMGKTGTVLHPTQNRVVTVRECARAQGFPDHFEFITLSASSVVPMHRQVGNAVPPPLAQALAKELVNAVLDRLLMANQVLSESETTAVKTEDATVDPSGQPLPPNNNDISQLVLPVAFDRAYLYRFGTVSWDA